MSSCDVIVAGLGITGAAAVRELARRGIGVLGIDALEPPHDRGSSHGPTRIIRQAYYENPLYVPMVRRAFDLWALLEAESGTKLITPSPALMVGVAAGDVVRGTLDSVRTHSLPHEVLDAAAIRAHYPDLHPADDMVGVLEMRAGLLAAETSHRAMLASARAHGAALATNERLRSFTPEGSGVRVETDTGIRHSGCLVLACGGWLPDVLHANGIDAGPYRVERQVVAHFEAADGRTFDSGRCPILLVEDPRGILFYTLPDAGHGLKGGIHHGGEVTTADRVDRVVSERDIDAIRSLMSRYMPAAGGALLDSTVCLYTNTPDSHFVLDRVPGMPAVILASACSGHGFKFAPVTGEIVADLAIDRVPAFDTGAFAATRFSS